MTRFTHDVPSRPSPLRRLSRPIDPTGVRCRGRSSGDLPEPLITPSARLNIGLPRVGEIEAMGVLGKQRGHRVTGGTGGTIALESDFGHMYYISVVEE